MFNTFLQKRKPLLAFLGWFIVCNSILLYVIGVRYLENLSYTVDIHGSLALKDTIIIWVFIMTAYLGHFAWLATLASLPSLLLILFWPQTALVKTIAIIVSSFLLYVVVIDTYVYALYHYHLNGIIWHMITSGEIRGVFGFTAYEWMLLVIFLFSIIVIEIIIALFLARVLARQRYPRWRRFFWLSFLVSWCISFILFFAAMLHHYRFISDASRALPWYNNMIATVLPPDTMVLMVKQNAEYFLQARQATRPLNYPLASLQCKAPKKPLNLVIIMIDTWRFNMLTHDVMPKVSQFAQNAWVFNHHMSGGNCTGPGVFSFFYSIPYSYWTAMLEQKQAPVFIRQLLKDHYQTGIYASAELIMPAFNKTVFLPVKDLQVKTKGDQPYDRDQTITKQFQTFLSKVARNKKPFFGFLFYNSAHAITFPPDFKVKFKPYWKKLNRSQLTQHSDPTLFLNRYKNVVYYIDGLVGKVLADLKEKGLLQNTMVVITGDHGQEFNDTHRNYWGHASNYTRFQLQTPLIIYWPSKKPRAYDYLTTHYDLVPFLMKNVLGCDVAGQNYSVGKPLLKSGERPFFIVSSYIDTGIVQKGRYTTILPSGEYVIYNAMAKPMPNATLDTAILKKAFEQMQLFYR